MLTRPQILSRRDDLLVFDDFERDNGALGTPVTGNSPWIVAPNAALGAANCVVPVISGGQAVVPDESVNSLATYFSQNLDSQVTEIGCIAGWVGAGNHGYGAIGQIISQNPADGVSNYHIIRSKCIHMVFTSAYFTLGFFDGTIGGPLSTLPAVYYPAACALDGTKHPFRYRIDPATGVIRVMMPGGSVKLLQDDRIKTYGGQTVTWEHFATPPPSGGAPDPRFSSVWAR